MLKRAYLFLFLLSTSAVAENLTWCAYFNWNPWIYPVSSGYAGIMIDQLELFKKNNPDITVQIRKIDNWKRCQAEVASGKVTMILGANKTPEREVIFDYLPEPAFLNVSTVGVYTAQDNTEMKNIQNINDLRNYQLAMVRGNSYGSAVDPFVKSLAGKEINELSSQAQTLKLVSVKRVDYFFLPVGTLEATIEKNLEKFPELADAKFKLVYEIPRSTPAFYVFGKNTGNYSNYADKWLATLKEYYSNVNFEDEVKRHKAQK